MYKERFNAALIRHLKISRDVGKHFLKVGKKETSVLISQEVTIVNDEDAHLKTTISLLPVRRMGNSRAAIVDNDDLLFEMDEDVEV